MPEGFDEHDMDKLLKWLDDNVTEYRMGPIQLIVFVSAAIFLAFELIRWL